ncbi:SUMF1/EgtB/PvdO family nonheme iron enzyme, partial [Acinetobacter baumannii]
KPYRLLSEAEWEYAARAGSAADYAWGDEIERNRANCNGCGSPWDNQRTAPVGSFRPNAFGLFDMHGNVWEWVEDCYRETYF